MKFYGKIIFAILVTSLCGNAYSSDVSLECTLKSIWSLNNHSFEGRKEDSHLRKKLNLNISSDSDRGVAYYEVSVSGYKTTLPVEVIWNATTIEINDSERSMILDRKMLKMSVVDTFSNKNKRLGSPLVKEFFDVPCVLNKNKENII